jgi:hypothetical protein
MIYIVRNIEGPGFSIVFPYERICIPITAFIGTEIITDLGDEINLLIFMTTSISGDPESDICAKVYPDFSIQKRVCIKQAPRRGPPVQA